MSTDFHVLNIDEETTTSELEQEVLVYDDEVEPFSIDFMIEMLDRLIVDIHVKPELLVENPDLTTKIEQLRTEVYD